MGYLHFTRKIVVLTDPIHGFPEMHFSLVREDLVILDFFNDVDDQVALVNFLRRCCVAVVGIRLSSFHTCAILSFEGLQN